MKYLSICILALAFVSCQKKYCWKCAVQATYPAKNGQPAHDTTYYRGVCDKTKDEIGDVEYQMAHGYPDDYFFVGKVNSASCDKD